MTAPVQILIAAKRLGVTAFAISLNDTKAQAQGAPSAAFQLKNDGTIFVAGNNSTTTSPNWYLPTNAAIGQSYWTKLQLNSGTPWDASGPANGAVVRMDSNPYWPWSRSTQGQSAANCTVSIYSDAGGVNRVFTTTFAVICQLNP